MSGQMDGSAAAAGGPAALAERVAALPSEQRIALLRRLAASGQPLAAALGAVPLRVDQGPAPLSPAQEDLRMFELLYPDSAAINLCSAYHFDGPVDPAGLEAALELVVARHDVLRGAVRGTPGELRMELVYPARVPFAHVDLRVHGKDADHEYARVADEFRRATFDLENDRLIRATFVVLDEERRVLLMSLHHVVADWWSFDVLHTEFAKAYRAILDGAPYDTARSEVQYAHYAAWQRELEAAGVFDRQLGFWRRYLADLPPAPALGVQREPGVSALDAVKFEFLVDEELIRAVEVFAREQGATLFHALTAAFAVFAARVSGVYDVVVGTPVANRHARGLDQVVGYVMNMVATRWRLRPQDDFGSLVRAFVAEFGELAENADVPIGRVIADVNPERVPGRSPLIRWLFMYLPGQESIHQLPEAARHERLSSGAEENDFALILRNNRRGEIRLNCEFRADLFDPALVRRWLEAYLELVPLLVRDGGRTPIGQVPLLPGARRAELVESWAAGTRPQSGLPVAEAFRAQAVATPQAPAVVFNGSTLTYAELDAASDALAAGLLARGVGRESVVAVCLPRSFHFPVALLGVLKAGAAFLPLDPLYPAERLRMMVEDSMAALALVTGETAHVMSATGLECIELDAPAAASPTESCAPAAVASSPHDLGYIIYTSGSTGRPKGVAVEQGALTQLVHAQAASYQTTADDRVLQFASYSFDAVLQELLPALVSGGCVVLGGDPSRTSVAELMDTARRHDVTVLCFPTAYWHEVVRSLSSGHELPPTVRLVVIGGEAVNPAAVAAWFECGAKARLLNTYGPTETTVTALSHEPVPGVPDSATAIGRALAGQRAYVLDARLEPVPAGVVGELYLAGAGLARGYVGRGALTVERFVADPFAPVPGGRMYRTGDRCWYDVDGDVHFLGRSDQQVKIRGFRIEPGEVEAVLASCAGVGGCGVLARPDARTGESRLIAYVVPNGTGAASAGTLDTAALTTQLAKYLPSYMLPSAYVVLDALPLTPSGKLDRAALPEPAASDVPIGARPMTAAEQTLAELFAEVLGLPAVGPDDSFFALGGHSLLATRLAARIHAALGRDPGLQALFEAPTPARLAARLGAAPARPARVRPPLVRRAVGERGLAPEPQPTLPLSSAQMGLWFASRTDGRPNALFNMPYRLLVRGPLDHAALRLAVADVAERHESLRTVFPETDGMPGQLVIEELPADAWRESACTLEESEALILAEAEHVFDLSVEPPIRVTLLDCGGDVRALLVLIHHVASDGWSARVFWQDLAEAYAARRHGEEPGWAPLPVQYADYVFWQRELLGDPADPQSYAAELFGYWVPTLSGMPEELALPYDFERPDALSSVGVQLPLCLDADLHQRLIDLARETDTTLFMTVQAAVAVLLSRYGAGTDIPIGTVVAGRGEPELEPMVGAFINTLVLRTDVSGRPAFRELLARVRATDLAAYEHQELPFEYVVPALHPEREPSMVAPFRALIAFDTGGLGHPRLDGAALEFHPVPANVARLDLIFHFVDQHDEDGGPAGVLGAIEYDTALFRPETAQELANGLVRILTAAVAAPDTLVDELAPSLRGR